MVGTESELAVIRDYLLERGLDYKTVVMMLTIASNEYERATVYWKSANYSVGYHYGQRSTDIELSGVIVDTGPIPDLRNLESSILLIKKDKP